MATKLALRPQRRRVLVPRLPSKARGERREGRVAAGGSAGPAPPLPCTPARRGTACCARPSPGNPARPARPPQPGAGQSPYVRPRFAVSTPQLSTAPPAGQGDLHHCLPLCRPLPGGRAASCVLPPRQAEACALALNSCPGLGRGSRGLGVADGNGLDAPRRRSRGRGGPSHSWGGADALARG